MYMIDIRKDRYEKSLDHQFEIKIFLVPRKLHDLENRIFLKKHILLLFVAL